MKIALASFLALSLFATSAFAHQKLILATSPEPDPVPPLTSAGAGRAPLLIGPGLRFAPAYSLRLNRAPRSAFALDAISGMRIGLHRGDEQWVLAPELGWSWRTPGAEQFLTVGLGFGRGHGDSAPISDAHTQVLWEAGTTSHDFRAGVSLDLGLLILRNLFDD